LAQEFADRFVVIDGARSIEDVSLDVLKTADEHLAAL
jgi:thymidylate kinase